MSLWVVVGSTHEDHGRCFCVYVYVHVYVYVYVCFFFVLVSRVYYRHSTQLKRAFLFFEKQPLSRSATSVHASSTAAAAQRQLCFKLQPLCKEARCMCVVGAQ